MTKAPLSLDHRATEEFDAAADWYEAVRTGLGEQFIEAVEEAIGKIAEHPGLGGPVPGVGPESQVRRTLLAKFPYAVVYLESDREIIIVAIAHSKQRPGYWRDRLSR